MLTNRFKHCLHCCIMMLVILLIEIWPGKTKVPQGVVFISATEFNPWTQYGYPQTLILYFLRVLSLFSLPAVILTFVGLVYYNTFPDDVVLKTSPNSAPFICFRVVTRGNFPQLVKDTVNRNINTCVNVGLENFLIEVVTDQNIGLVPQRRVREVVVPPEYCTKSGALFKARALQYCLEDNVNLLSPNDWIVHLDEETLLTENSVKGILNFIWEGKHSLGQGVITYASDKVVNWITTLSDCHRVVEDIGRLKLEFKVFHKPLFGWKGSFMVIQSAVEQDVSFENGLDGSISEDAFFAAKAWQRGYTFDFIEGEMWEKSPFTIWDSIQQRKRWLQGGLLLVSSKTIPLRYKFFVSCFIYTLVVMPLMLLGDIVNYKYPIPCPIIIEFFSKFLLAMQVYMKIFGAIKSFSVKKYGRVRVLLFACLTVVLMPYNIMVAFVSSIWAIFSKKHVFYVVDKNVPSFVEKYKPS